MEVVERSEEKKRRVEKGDRRGGKEKGKGRDGEGRKLRR